ncbi:MAG: alpha/beta fold hydrolase [Thermoanaerobaculia bacterium]
MNDIPKPDRSGHLAVDEHSIYWELFGDGSREVVCLLNGLAMHTGAWYGFLSRLRPEYDVLLWDYPGQGRSDTADVPYYLDRIAGYLVGILDENRVERTHVIGISYGGFVALEFARQFQSRLHTLTLSGIILSHETLFEMYEDLSLHFYRGGPEAFDLYTRYMYEKIFGEAFVRIAGAARLESMRQSFYERYHDRTTALIRLTQAQDPFFAALDERMPQYRAIAAPTLVIAGDEDRVMAPKVQRKIASILPNSRFVLIEDSGHVVYLEQTDRFFGLVLGLMRTKSILTNV